MPDGGPSEDPLREERLRPVPRPQKTGNTAPVPIPVPVPAHIPVVERSAAAPGSASASGDTATPRFRPDRSRMDPLSLDRATTRKMSGWFRRAKQIKTRSRLARKMDRLLIRSLFVVMMGGGLAVGVWNAKLWFNRNATSLLAPVSSAAAAPAVSLSDRTLDMLEAFLTASSPDEKLRHVLDPVRVERLVREAWESGHLPEDRLRFGVPQPLEPGVLTVPAKVSGTPGFVLHLMVREVDGEPRLDWETYEQEMSQRWVAFSSHAGGARGEFRLVLERAHAFAAAPEENVAVRLAAPGAAAMADPVLVRPDIAPALEDALPWNRQRRALVLVEWQKPEKGTPRLVLCEILKWDFLP